MSNAVAEINPNELKESESMPPASGEWFAEPLRHEESAGLPEWYRDLQTESWHTYLETPDPQRTDENWRFATLRNVKFGSLKVAEPVTNPDVVIADSEARGLQSVSARFVFANNRLIHVVFNGDARGDTRQLVGHERGGSAEHDVDTELRQQVDV